jgi:hypothetical protein
MATDHQHDDAHHSHGSDKPAAFTGLILGVIALTAIVYGVTMWTNSRFEGKKGEHVEATK